MNNRLNLLIPDAVAQRLEEETIFLGVRQRIFRIEEREIRSKADIIRWAVQLYVSACEAGETHELEYEETTAVPFYVAQGDRGFWDYAIKAHFAQSYHQLASLALHRYFELQNQQQVADRVIVQHLLAIAPNKLLPALRSGELNV